MPRKRNLRYSLRGQRKNTKPGEALLLRVLLSTAIASQRAAHGGPVIARRHALALRRAGVQVSVAAPDGGDARVDGDIEVHGYRASVPKPLHFPGHRPNRAAADSLAALIDRLRPDILYDVHGPAWAVDAAAQARLPVVSMVGDYAWYCRRTFLVDSRLQRCSGPGSMAKCFSCLNRHYSPQRRLVHIALKHASHLGVPIGDVMPGRLASLRLWDAVQESEGYVSQVRGKVDVFVVGDAQAEDFFVAHGVPRGRLVRIAQCLPREALVARRADGDSPRTAARPLRIAFVGRPAADKGIHVLARAFEELPAGLAAELWIVHAEDARRESVEPHFREARRFRSMLEAGRVRLFQPQSNDEVLRLMARADVGIVPSIAFESPSLALLEFVAQGTPVIRSESRGMDHVIQDRVNGRTFPYGDAVALRGILAEVCADPGMLERWRDALPRIGADDDYARSLIAIFARLGAQPTVAQENAHS